MNRYTFEALDADGEPVSNKTEHQFHTVITAETLMEQCKSIARNVMHEFPREDPWRDWSIEMGVRLDGKPEWTLTRHTFRELLAG